jgi:hypothetical protein
MVDHLGHRRRVVRPDAAHRPGAADHDHRQPDPVQGGQPRVVRARIDDQHPVHPLLGGPPPVHGDLLVEVRDELQSQPETAGGQLGLDAGDQPAAEHLDREGRRRAQHHQPERLGGGAVQGQGVAVHPVAQLAGDADDLLAQRGRDAGPAVQGVGHGDPGDTRAPGDVGHGRLPHQNAPPLPLFACNSR